MSKNKSSLINGVPASFVVFLVALPLCMGIAIASGASQSCGLITGMIGGIIVGSISGSPLLASGSAADWYQMFYLIRGISSNINSL